MNKTHIYKELEECWNIFNMTNKEIENAYYTITGLTKSKGQTILDLKDYLLEFILEQMIQDGELTIECAAEIHCEVMERWK